MHLAYSAINTVDDNHNQRPAEELNNELMLRYEAYQSVCKKFSHEIAAIQKYISGWRPSPPAP